MTGEFVYFRYSNHVFILFIVSVTSSASTFLLEIPLYEMTFLTYKTSVIKCFGGLVALKAHVPQCCGITVRH